MVYPLRSTNVLSATNALSTISQAMVNDDGSTASPDDDSVPSADKQSDEELEAAIDNIIDPIPSLKRLKTTKGPGKFKKCTHSPLDDSESERDNGMMSDLGSSDEGELEDPSIPSSPSLKIVERRGGSDDESGRVRVAGGKWITSYENNALKKRAKNKKLMAKFDIPTAVQTAIGRAPPPKSPSPKCTRVRPTSRVLPLRASKSQTKS